MDGASATGRCTRCLLPGRNARFALTIVIRQAGGGVVAVGAGCTEKRGNCPDHHVEGLSVYGRAYSCQRSCNNVATNG